MPADSGAQVLLNVACYELERDQRGSASLPQRVTRNPASRLPTTRPAWAIRRSRRPPIHERSKSTLPACQDRPGARRAMVGSGSAKNPPGGEGRPSRSGLDPAIAHAIESVRGRPASLRRGDPTGDHEAFTVGEDARAEAACRSRA